MYNFHSFWLIFPLTKYIETSCKVPNIENPRKLFNSAMSLCCLCVKLMSLFIVGSTVSYFLGISHAWLLSKDNTVHRSKISLKSMAEFLLQLKLYLGGRTSCTPWTLVLTLDGCSEHVTHE